VSSIGSEWFVESLRDEIATGKKKREKERGKGTGASKTVSGIINCRDDLITQLNELPAAASRSCHGSDTFSSFGRTEWNVT